MHYAKAMALTTVAIVGFGVAMFILGVAGCLTPPDCAHADLRYQPGHIIWQWDGNAYTECVAK